MRFNWKQHALEDWTPLPRTKKLYAYDTVMYGQRVTVVRYATLPMPEQKTIPAIPNSEHNLLDYIVGDNYNGAKVNRKNRGS